MCGAENATIFKIGGAGLRQTPILRILAFAGSELQLLSRSVARTFAGHRSYEYLHLQARSGNDSRDRWPGPSPDTDLENNCSCKPEAATILASWWPGPSPSTDLENSCIYGHETATILDIGGTGFRQTPILRIIAFTAPKLQLFSRSVARAFAKHRS